MGTNAYSTATTAAFATPTAYSPTTISPAPVTTMSSPMFAAPAVEYMSPAPAVEYVTSAPAVEYVTAAPQVMFQSAAPRDLLAMGVVVSERVVSVDELAAEGRLVQTEPEQVIAVSAPTVAAPIVYETFV